MTTKKRDFKYISGKKYDGMMGRCYRLTDGSFDGYGGRGIKVCSDWIQDIESFRDWVKNQLIEIGFTEEEFVAYPRKFSLDRINVNQHYEPNNCRLVSSQTQMRNTRRVKRIVISSEGKEFIV